MWRLIKEDPRNQEVIFPYIGAEEVNSSPAHAHHRYVINFGERSENECRRRWPDLMTIVETKVKPERTNLKDNPDAKRRKQYWWQYGRYPPGLFAAIAGRDKVLVTGAAAVMHHMIAAVPSNQVFSHKLIVFPLAGPTSFAVLQSRIHEIWSAFFGTTFGSADALTYNPSRVFQTFPFPANWETHPSLDTSGMAYSEFRAALMVKNNEGLTKTYNRFHHPDDTSREIETLRGLHAAMDYAVFAAYGWTDIPTDCEFLLEYEIDEEEWGDKRKPWRYRWPDEVRDEVLARLLELNAERAKEEARAGVGTAGERGGKARAMQARGTRS